MSNPTFSTGSVDLPAAGSYRIDPTRSSVNFRIYHMFGLGRVSGAMKIASGKVTVDPVLPAVGVQVTVDTASVDTGLGMRDNDVRRRFLKVKKYPELTFNASDLIEAGDGRELRGSLVVRGVSAPVTLKINSAELTDRGFRAQASTRIDRYAVGVTTAKGMAGRFLDVELTVQAELIG